MTGLTERSSGCGPSALMLLVVGITTAQDRPFLFEELSNVWSLPVNINGEFHNGSVIYRPEKCLTSKCV